LQVGPPVGVLLLLALQVKLLVEVGEGTLDVGFGLLEVVFEHASHAVEFESLVSVHLILEFLLLLSFSLLLDLFI
jgi:hypothetical protein